MKWAGNAVPYLFTIGCVYCLIFLKLMQDKREKYYEFNRWLSRVPVKYAQPYYWLITHNKTNICCAYRPTRWSTLSDCIEIFSWKIWQTFIAVCAVKWCETMMRRYAVINVKSGCTENAWILANLHIRSWKDQRSHGIAIHAIKGLKMPTKKTPITLLAMSWQSF